MARLLGVLGPGGEPEPAAAAPSDTATSRGRSRTATRSSGTRIRSLDLSLPELCRSTTRPFDAVVARVSVETPVIAVRADAPWKTLKGAHRSRAGQSRQVRIEIPAPAVTHHFSAFRPVRHRRRRSSTCRSARARRWSTCSAAGSRARAAAGRAGVARQERRSQGVGGAGLEARSGFRMCRPRTSSICVVTLDMWRGIAVRPRACSRADRRQAAGRHQANGRVAAVQGRRQGDRVCSGVLSRRTISAR